MGAEAINTARSGPTRRNTPEMGRLRVESLLVVAGELSMLRFGGLLLQLGRTAAVGCFRNAFHESLESLFWIPEVASLRVWSVGVIVAWAENRRGIIAPVALGTFARQRSRYKTGSWKRFFFIMKQISFKLP